MESLDKGIWDAIENGHFVPKFEKDGSVIEKPWSQWTDSESKKAKFDCIAKNIITSALNSEEFFRVSQCKLSKEMWDTLEVTHEGTNEVKRARKLTLIQEYEMFRMLKGETIAEVQKRFTHIINHLMSLDKTFEKEELNIKILKCLDRAWQAKVTAISESKNLTSLSMASLFGKLREHELEINRLNVQESEDKHIRSIALKASSDDSDEENLNLPSRKFSKFLKRNRNKDNNKDRYGNKKSNDFDSNNYTCFGCGEQGHIKADCPNKSKEKKPSYNKKKGNTKRAYTAWDENEVSSSSSSSSEDEKANICLIVEDDDESCSSSEISSCASLNEQNYSELLEAFQETHDEANRLVLSNNRLKELNNWLEKRVKSLENEIEKSKNDFVPSRPRALTKVKVKDTVGPHEGPEEGG